MLEFLAEQKLSEAVSRGELDKAANKVQPLNLRIEQRYYGKALKRLGRLR